MVESTRVNPLPKRKTPGTRPPPVVMLLPVRQQSLCLAEYPHLSSSLLLIILYGTKSELKLSK